MNRVRVSEIFADEAQRNDMSEQAEDLVLMTTVEVTALLRVTKVTLWRMIKAGRFPPSIKFGHRSRRWRKSDVIAFIESLQAADGNQNERGK